MRQRTYSDGLGPWRSSAQDYGEFTHESYGQRDSTRGYGQKAIEEVVPRPDPPSRIRLRPSQPALGSAEPWVRSSDSYGGFAKDLPSPSPKHGAARQPYLAPIEQASNLPPIQAPTVLSAQQMEVYQAPSLQSQQQHQLQQLQHLAAYQQQQLQYLQVQLQHALSREAYIVQPPAFATPAPPALDRAYYQAPRAYY